MRNRGHNKKLVSRLSIVTFALMIAANVLANVLPINGVTTAEISNKYDNLFTPSGYVFAIWFVIYILLAYYTFYQITFNSRRPDNNDRVVRRVNLFFSISNVVNVLWILAWHYEFITGSLVLMCLLFVLLFMARSTISNRSSMSVNEIRSIQIPFSIYFGWISVALIGNVMAYLSFSGRTLFGLNDEMLAVAGVVTAGVIIIVSVFGFNDITIGMVALFALSGIIVRHMNAPYNGEYMSVVISSGLVAPVTVLVCVYVLYKGRKKKRRRGRR